MARLTEEFVVRMLQSEATVRARFRLSDHRAVAGADLERIETPRHVNAAVGRRELALPVDLTGSDSPLVVPAFTAPLSAFSVMPPLVEPTSIFPVICSARIPPLLVWTTTLPLTEETSTPPLLVSTDRSPVFGMWTSMLSSRLANVGPTTGDSRSVR